MRYYFLFVITILVFFLKIKAVAAGEVIQVEGLMLGYFPAIADGVRVQTDKAQNVTFSPGHRCLEHIQVERSGSPANGVNFEAEDRRVVRSRLVGSRRLLQEEWLRTASGLASDFYRDNLTQDPRDQTVHLLFVPMVLSPKPVSLIRSEWTPQAKEILAREGMPGLERFCGTHFVQAVGEESFVVYSLKINFPSAEERVRYERIRLDAANISPTILLNNLQRMRQRFEFFGQGRDIVVDVLQVGGRLRDVSTLREELSGQNVRIESESVPTGSLITRAQLTCGPDQIEQCHKMAQLFLDFQFRRLNFNGERPAFTPVRFRIAPLAFAVNLTN